MPSWNDGSESSQSYLGDITDRDYAPDICEDPTFRGLAVGCNLFCRIHNLPPQKCVAFEGTNTRRRFYMCSVVNEVENCGFVCWLDSQEWPETLQNALSRLWAMYHESNNGRIDDRVANGKFLEELADEKNKIEKKYLSLVSDMNKFMDETAKRVMQENLAKIKQNSEHTLGNGQAEIKSLKSEIAVLKQVQKTQADIIKAREKEWDDERKDMKEEKKKLEYMLFDRLKASDGSKDKLKRIKAICDE